MTTDASGQSRPGTPDAEDSTDPAVQFLQQLLPTEDAANKRIFSSLLRSLAVPTRTRTDT